MPNRGEQQQIRCGFIAPHHLQRYLQSVRISHRGSMHCSELTLHGLLQWCSWGLKVCADRLKVVYLLSEQLHIHAQDAQARQAPLLSTGTRVLPGGRLCMHPRQVQLLLQAARSRRKRFKKLLLALQAADGAAPLRQDQEVVQATEGKGAWHPPHKPREPARTTHHDLKDASRALGTLRVRAQNIVRTKDDKENEGHRWQSSPYLGSDDESASNTLRMSTSSLTSDCPSMAAMGTDDDFPMRHSPAQPSPRREVVTVLARRDLANDFVTHASAQTVTISAGVADVTSARAAPPRAVLLPPRELSWLGRLWHAVLCGMVEWERVTTALQPSLASASHAVCGQLTKRGSGFPWNWKRRFAVFDLQSRTLAYYSCEAAATAGDRPKGQIRVKQLRASEEGQFGLAFVGEERTMLAQAPSAGEWARWVAALGLEHEPQAQAEQAQQQA